MEASKIKENLDSLHVNDVQTVASIIHLTHKGKENELISKIMEVPVDGGIKKNKEFLENGMSHNIERRDGGTFFATN